MPFSQFDRSRLVLQPLAQRVHDLDRSALIFPDSPRQPFSHPAIPLLAERIVAAARAGRNLPETLRSVDRPFPAAYIRFSVYA